MPSVVGTFVCISSLAQRHHTPCALGKTVNENIPYNYTHVFHFLLILFIFYLQVKAQKSLYCRKCVYSNLFVYYPASPSIQKSFMRPAIAKSYNDVETNTYESWTLPGYLSSRNIILSSALTTN